MKVLVCGGRHYDERDTVWKALNELHGVYGITTIITGGARGADAWAHAWALAHNVATEIFPADWETFGKSAGPIRNIEMLRAKPDRVLAFPGGAGTAHMVKVATDAGINITRCS